MHRTVNKPAASNNRTTSKQRKRERFFPFFDAQRIYLRYVNVHCLLDCRFIENVWIRVAPVRIGMRWACARSHSAYPRYESPIGNSMLDATKWTITRANEKSSRMHCARHLQLHTEACRRAKNIQIVARSLYTSWPFVLCILFFGSGSFFCFLLFVYFHVHLYYVDPQEHTKRASLITENQ